MSFDLSEKWRRRRKINRDRFFRIYDRFRHKLWSEELGFPRRWWLRRDRSEKDYNLGRKKSHTDTGYGVAHEKRGDEVWD